MIIHIIYKNCISNYGPLAPKITALAFFSKLKSASFKPQLREPEPSITSQIFVLQGILRGFFLVFFQITNQKTIKK